MIRVVGFKRNRKTEDFRFRLSVRLTEEFGETDNHKHESPVEVSVSP